MPRRVRVGDDVVFSVVFVGERGMLSAPSIFDEVDLAVEGFRWGYTAILISSLYSAAEGAACR